MSERCGTLGGRHPTMPHMVEECARLKDHPPEHCSILHKPGGEATCPRCAPVVARVEETTLGNERPTAYYRLNDPEGSMTDDQTRRDRALAEATIRRCQAEGGNLADSLAEMIAGVRQEAWQVGHDAACPQGPVCSAHQPSLRAVLAPAADAATGGEGDGESWHEPCPDEPGYGEGDA